MKKLNYTEKLKAASIENNSIICLELDPRIKEMHLKGTKEHVITKYFIDILSSFVSENVRPGSIILNYSKYAQYGLPGLKAMKKIIRAFQKEDFMVILDAKKSETGENAKIAAKEIFDFWKVDATTITPFLGKESVQPFINYYRKGKGTYIITRTFENPFEDIEIDEKPIFLKTAEKIIKWHMPGTSSYIQSKTIEEIKGLSNMFAGSGRNIPMLIRMQGSTLDVFETLKDTKNDIKIQRIVPIEDICYAYQKEASTDYAGSATKALKELNEKIKIK